MWVCVEHVFTFCSFTFGNFRKMCVSFYGMQLCYMHIFISEQHTRDIWLVWQWITLNRFLANTFLFQCVMCLCTTILYFWYHLSHLIYFLRFPVNYYLLEFLSKRESVHFLFSKTKEKTTTNLHSFSQNSKYYLLIFSFETMENALRMRIFLFP